MPPNMTPWMIAAGSRNIRNVVPGGTTPGMSATRAMAEEFTATSSRGKSVPGIQLDGWRNSRTTARTDSAHGLGPDVAEPAVARCGPAPTPRSRELLGHGLGDLGLLGRALEPAARGVGEHVVQAGGVELHVDHLDPARRPAPGPPRSWPPRPPRGPPPPVRRVAGALLAEAQQELAGPLLVLGHHVQAQGGAPTTALSAAGVPSRTMRPWSMMATRWASSSASSRYWVVRNTVVPVARC